MLPGPADAPAASTAVALSKSFTNVMDTGTVTFTFTLAVLTSWNKTGRAVVDVPKSYRPDLGENVACSLWKAVAAAADGTASPDEKLEDLYCAL